MADEKNAPTPEETPEPKAPKQKKGKDAGEDKEKKAPQPKKGDYGPDFKYIVRLASTDLDGTKAVRIALTGVKGVGHRVARILADETKVPADELIGNLTDEQVEALQDAIDGAGETMPYWAVNRQFDYDTGEHVHVVGPEVDSALRDDLNRMKKIRSYKGVRHDAGLPVRGQRTRANGRTGLTVGVQRAKAQAAAASEAKEES